MIKKLVQSTASFKFMVKKKLNNSIGREHELHPSLEKPSRFDMDEWLEMGVA